MSKRPRRPAPEPPIFTFRVRITGGWNLRDDASGVMRDIEIAANQTMADLGELIPEAFAFEDPHLWSFFLSGRAWDRDSEYTLVTQSAGFLELDSFMEPTPARRADESLIRDVPFPPDGGEFLFLFDYGDQWEFGVRLVVLSDAIVPGARYPRVAQAVGNPPPQYPTDDEGDETS